MRERRSREASVSLKKAPLTPAEAYEERSLAKLRSAGFRITMPRVQVIRALADTDHALSAYAVHEKILDSGGKIDVVSVYRILSTLQEVGLIHHIGILNGYFPCRVLECDGGRSEVLVDGADGSVTELALPSSITDTIAAQAKDLGLEVRTIKLEIVVAGR